MALTRVAVVTGSNKGIGLSIVKLLCQKFEGDVYLTARNEQRGKDAVKQLEEKGLKPKFHLLDIEDKESINSLKAFLGKEYQGLDVLVNNAAIMMASTVPKVEQAENTVKVNFLDTLNVCRALFPLLRPNARVVNMSSFLGMLAGVSSPEIKARFTSPTLTEGDLCQLVKEYLDDVRNNMHLDKGWPKTSFALSKVALAALSFIQQKQFNADPREDLVVNAVHPGYVNTDMTNHKGPLTPDQGANAPAYLALLPPNVKEPRGQMVWFDRQIVDWTGPLPKKIT